MSFSLLPHVRAGEWCGGERTQDYVWLCYLERRDYLGMVPKLIRVLAAMALGSAAAAGSAPPAQAGKNVGEFFEFRAFSALRAGRCDGRYPRRPSGRTGSRLRW